MFDPALPAAIRRATKECGQPDSVAEKILNWLTNRRRLISESEDIHHFDLICAELDLDSAEDS
ncbi:MAG: hypothetical protein OXH31_08740 [Gammaproteobacteria bacterium]|nr:hypothetical protein [Gammaproteobacteria bacterium]